MDKKQAAEKALEAGYREAKKESLAIADEFVFADVEDWDDYLKRWGLPGSP